MARLFKWVSSGLVKIGKYLILTSVQLFQVHNVALKIIGALSLIDVQSVLTLVMIAVLVQIVDSLLL